MKELIPRDKSVIVSCDVSIELNHQILKSTHKIEEVGAYKYGFMLAFRELSRVVGFAKECFTPKPIIYDHQKAGTDTPHMANGFVREVKDAGVDAVILYPLAGKETQKAWTLSALEKGLVVLSGGLMSHYGFLRSEGGYIADEAVVEMYVNAISLGVNNFVLPATKNRIEQTRGLVELIKREAKDPVFYFVGVGEKGQGGKMQDVKNMGLYRYYIIVGRDIHQTKAKKESEIEKKIRQATIDYIAQL